MIFCLIEAPWQQNSIVTARLFEVARGPGACRLSLEVKPPNGASVDERLTCRHWVFDKLEILCYILNIVIRMEARSGFVARKHAPRDRLLQVTAADSLLSAVLVQPAGEPRSPKWLRTNGGFTSDVARTPLSLLSPSEARFTAIFFPAGRSPEFVPNPLDQMAFSDFQQTFSEPKRK